MAIDYEQICKDNIEEYGKGTRHLAFFERLYSDGTHFIFEIVQNAEDAKAHKIDFQLFDDRLEVRHDGRPFNEKDVRGVCGVGEGTKEGDLTQIGRFGIGFKSVYALTSTPVIHCGEEHFEIRHYVRPHTVAARSVATPWSTLIIIPFDKEGVGKEHAATEIAKRLRCLSVRTLLFLANVSEIEYRLPNGESGTYLKSKESCVCSSLVTVMGEKSVANDTESEQWLVFEKAILNDAGERIVGPNGTAVPPVQVAFLLEDQDADTRKTKQGANLRDLVAQRKQPWARKKVKALNSSPLVVFFPTEKESQLGFLIQGPYRTTPARDNIPPSDDWNVTLIDETATLLVHSALPALKEMKLLTVGCFDALPIRKADFDEDSFFYPIAAAVREALLENELLPAANGTFVSGENAILGRGEDLRSLLGNEQLALLFGLDRNVRWLSGEITADKAPTLRDYLRSELEITEVAPDSLPPVITAEFMQQQPDEWVINFYTCLLSWEALWKPRRESWNRASLRDRPFLRLEDGTHVTPFDEDGHPNAYLPLKGTTQLPVVKSQIANDKSAREFLKRLGMSEPDIVAEVIGKRLPLYMCMDSIPSAREHTDHMNEILAAWSTDSIVQKKRLEKELQETPFVRYHCRATGVHGYAKPGEVYFFSNDLLTYFDSNEDAKFVVTSYPQAVRDLLAELGVQEVPRCFQVDYGDPPCRHYSTRGTRIENYILDGLDEYLARLIAEDDHDARQHMSLCLWRYLLAYAASGDDCFQATRHYFYYSPSRQVYNALFVITLREIAWIPTLDGRFVKPPEVSIDQLLDGFELNQRLVDALGIQPDPSQEVEQERQAKSNLAQQLGINLEDAEFIAQHHDEFEQFRQAMLQRAVHEAAVDEASSGDRERRRRKLIERREQAPTKGSVMKLRSVPNHSPSDIDRQTLFDFYHDTDDEVLFCQMCLDPMPFIRRNGEECGECVDLFTRGWAEAVGYDLRVLTSLHLVLCPVCSEVYRDYVHKDVAKQTELFQHLTNGGDGKVVVCDRDVRRDKKDCVLHFNHTHLEDIRDCLGQDASE